MVKVPPFMSSGVDLPSRARCEIAAISGDGIRLYDAAHPDITNTQFTELTWPIRTDGWNALPAAVSGNGYDPAVHLGIRLASPDARFSVMEIKWGLIPDMSGTQTLKDLVRLDVAKELTFTGRIVEAEEALALGLITRICEDPLAEAEKLAREIVGKSPDAIAAGKQLWEKVWSLDAEEGLRLEEEIQRTLIGGHNQIEAVKANFEKRPPQFRDRS
jgi:enoyl-CoA hydratase/carnithine racemase